MQCEHCELAFLHPMMSEEEEESFYKDYNKHVRARGMTVTTSPQEFHEKSIVTANERFEVVGDYFAKGSEVLEIGSSTGAFVSLLEDCRCCCVEPAGANREYSERFVEEAYSDVSEIPAFRKFDVICMFHVFEHIRSPVFFLEKCKKLLKPDGVILIEVPCIRDPLLTIYQLDSFKDFYFQPMHPFVYSERALDVCFNEAGFVTVQVLYYQRYGLDNHLSWLKHNQPGGDKELQLLFGANKEYKKKLMNVNITDTLFYCASTLTEAS